MKMMKYYKIPPKWAETLKVTDGRAVKHPDGWYMCVAHVLARLPAELAKTGMTGLTVDEAVERIGGCIYDREQALASQRGDAGYRMDQVQTGETPEEEVSGGTASEDVAAEGKEAEDE